MTENREGTTNAVVKLTLQQFPEKFESGDDPKFNNHIAWQPLSI